jgi:hypothetical protein
MRQITTQIEINTPVSRVWAILTDFARYPAWNMFIRKLEGEPKVGTRLRVLIQPPERKVIAFRPVVLRVEPERELRWLGRVFLPRLFDGEHSFVIVPSGEGKTVFRHSEQFRGVLVPFFWSSMAEQTRRGFESMNEALKRLAEAG